jgi:REP element-mobilizing transposase RayT
MPSHVHLLITPLTSVTKLLGSVKSATARRANVPLGPTGKQFWRDESYDRAARTNENLFGYTATLKTILSQPD